MLRILTIYLALMSSSCPALAQPVRPIPHLDAIDVPLKADDVRQFIHRKHEVIWLAQDPMQSIYLRARSIAWLALEGSLESYETLAHIFAFDPHPLIRRQALVSLTRVLAKAYPTQVEALLLDRLPTLNDALFQLATRHGLAGLEDRHHQR